MPPDPDKRTIRELKRAIKKRGTKVRRRELKRGLAENPDEAAEQAETFGRHSSASLNGQDQDASRRRE